MKSSTAFSFLFALPAIQAATLSRSQHDSMLERNFKNVLQEDTSKARLVARSPQGPASNPGEFTNVGLSNSNPANQEGATNSGSNAGSDYVPVPVMDPVAVDPAMPSGATGVRHHHRPSGRLPRPTGRPHNHHNGTGRWRQNHEPEVVEVDMEVEPDGKVAVEETLWTFNGTGWNSTNIPLPSGSIVGTVFPAPMATGVVPGAQSMGSPVPTSMMMSSGGPDSMGPTSTGQASMGAVSTGSPSFQNSQIRPGFTGPGERMTANEMTRNEVAADGTGMETGGMGGKRRWLSGWF